MDASTTRRRRRGIAAWVVAVVVAVAVAGVIVVVTHMRRDDSAHANNDRFHPSAWQSVMDGATDTGETTVNMARQAFSLTFVRLPGVEVPSGSHDDIQSGSAALRMMIAHWAELTHSEQSAVLSYLPSDDPTGTDSGDAIVTTSDGAAEQSDEPKMRPVGFVSVAAARVGSSRRKFVDGSGPDATTKQLIEARVAALRDLLDARSGGVLTGTVDLSFNTREVEPGSAAYTLPHSAGQLVTHPTPSTASLSGVEGTYAGCFVALNPRGWSATGSDLDFILAHELYHCYEGMFIGNMDVFYDSVTAPPWVIEGGANWAAAQVVPTSTYPASAWHEYLLIPSTPLFEQSYEAIGFWNHLGEVSAIDTWGALRRALGKPSLDALAQTDGNSDAFLDSWASSLFREPLFGPSWRTDGPTMAPVRPAPEEVTIDSGSQVSRRALPRAKALLHATIATDVLVIVSVGHVNLHNPTHDEANFGQVVYCAREEGCECPPGSANTSPALSALGERGISFGITATDKPAAVALGGFSLDDWCRKSNPPISKRPPSSSAGETNSGNGGDNSLCQEIVDRLGVAGLLNNPTMSPADIQACVAEILGNAGFGGGN
ncbi:MAG: hypothetical protein ABIR32_05405 [Ilumatobacteraceae bacterium]